ncbi:MAG: chemotaxis protein CheD [Caulobacteraceae bacterium]
MRENTVRATVGGPRPVHVVQGEHHVTDSPDAVLATILGSCVAACMRDPMAGVGGMNHFLLPRPAEGSLGADGVSHGVHAMELLVNALLARGARRERLEVKLFGGAKMIAGLTDIGALNADFAEDFVRREGLKNVGGSLRGEAGRRVQYWPLTGRARQAFLAKDALGVFDQERRRPAPAPAGGSLELF